MIDFLIQNLGLKKRIYAGYILTGSVALLIAIIAYSALSRTNSSISEYTNFTEFSNNNLAFVSKLSEMQRQALIYISDGHQSAANHVDSTFNELKKELLKLELTDTGEIRSLLSQINRNIDNYKTTFDAAKEQRSLQKYQIETELPQQSNNLVSNVQKLIDPTDKGNASRILNYTKAVNLILSVERNSYRYFDSLNAKYINSVSDDIERAKSLLLSSKSFEPNQRNVEVINRLLPALTEYEALIFESIQRTRGYLFLINVVMSAEIYETIYHSEKLSDLVLNKFQSNSSELSSTIDATTKQLLLSSLLLLMILIVSSVVISSSITVPIMRLANTFNLLSRGRSDTEIPEYRSNDVLSELTAAAESFKNSNIELEKRKDELERSNDELEQFVYTVSHDLKSPIVTSMGFIGIINKLASQGKFEEALSKLDRVSNANNRMSQLINDLLELSRVGRINIDKKEVDLNRLLHDFISSQSERIATKQFSVEIQNTLPAVYANESRILQVFENIFSNAFKYCVNRPDPKLEIGSVADENSVSLYFRDNGPGIPAEYHTKIFGLFYRLNPDIEGTGVGLSVTKKVMKYHGGDIWVESEPNKGATFWLKFPTHGDQRSGAIGNE